MNVDEFRWMWTSVNKSKKRFLMSMEASQDGSSLIRSRYVPQEHRWMKKFVLHCSFMIFQYKFCPYIKGRYPWNKVDKQRNLLLVSSSKFFSLRPTWKKFLNLPKWFVKKEKSSFNQIGLKINKEIYF